MFAGDSSPAARTSIFARCRTLAALTAAILLTAAALAACSSGASNETTPTATTPTPVETTASPTHSPTPTGALFELEDIPIPAEPMYPQEMLQVDEDGAKAFVRYLFDEMSWMYATGDSTEFAGVSHLECEYCAERVERIEQDNKRQTGLVAHITRFEVHPYPDLSNGWIVGVDFRLSGYRDWDLNTMRVVNVTADPEIQTVYFAVRHDSVGWVLLNAISKRPVDLIGELTT